MLRRSLVAILFASATAGFIAASCVEDCKEEYNSAVRSCKALFDEPADADDLQVCIESAKTEYQSCIEACDDDDE
jgi:hypothetical protein